MIKSYFYIIITNTEVLAGLRARELRDGSFKAEVGMAFDEGVPEGFRYEVSELHKRLGLRDTTGVTRRRFGDISVVVARGVLPAGVEVGELACGVDDVLRTGGFTGLGEPTVLPELHGARWDIISR